MRRAHGVGSLVLVLAATAAGTGAAAWPLREALLMEGLCDGTAGTRAAAAERSCTCMSVSMTPGASEHTRAPLARASCSSATQRVKWSMPALAAQ